EQWESYTQQIQALRTGQAFIRLPDDTVRRVATPTLPKVAVSAAQLQAVRQHYLHEYFRSLSQPVAGAAPVTTPAPSPHAGPQEHPIHRYHPDEHHKRSR
ncbi:MAG TPA: hypothetical protein VFF53_11595, partial [Geobacteraceae bacterium]|nr:hypothetical protein [Geobacteraceae bacterium]